MCVSKPSSAPITHLLLLTVNIFPRQGADRLASLGRRPYVAAAPVTMLLGPREAYCLSLLPAIPGARSSGIHIFGPRRASSRLGPLHSVGLPWDEPESSRATIQRLTTFPGPVC